MAKKEVIKKNKKTSKRGGKSKSGFLGRNALVITISVLVAFAAVSVMAWFGLQRHNGDGVWVTIADKSTSEAVTDSLKSALGSVEGSRVSMLWKLTGGTPERSHGRYYVDKGHFSIKTAWRIRGGMQTPVKVSWTDVRTMEQLAEKISKKMTFTPEDFMKACNKVLTDSGYTIEEFPAAFIPDTYEFYASASAESVVKKLVEHRNKYWRGMREEKAKEMGLTPKEAATLASIVEEESSKIDELPVIARLYMNRLDKGMPLQADPTVKFATGNFALKRITGEQLKIESAYNTYRHKGLPPGPIRIASQKGIEAVLDAPNHEYLYMCAKEDFSGYHNFATNYAEHQRNAARYQAELNKRDIH